MPEEDNELQEQPKKSGREKVLTTIANVKKIKGIWAFLMAKPFILVGIATVILLVFIIFIAIISLEEADRRDNSWGELGCATIAFEEGQSLESRVYGALIAILGLTREQGAGMMGNIRGESSFNPFRHEDRAWNHFGRFECGGWGLIQWTNTPWSQCPANGRRTGVANFVRERVGASIFDQYYRRECGAPNGISACNIPEHIVNAFIVAQVEYIQHEFETTERRAGGNLRRAPNIDAASDSVMLDYLRPPDTPARRAERRRWSHEIYNTVNPAVSFNQCEEGIYGDLGLFGGEWVMPLANFSRCSSGFGWRIHPVYGDRRHHDGIDLAAPARTPIFAVKSGTIVSAGWSGGYGYTVRIDHHDGWSSLYAHMRAHPPVSRGQQVSQGQRIGEVGSTGVSTGDHLHLEIRRPGGSLANPAPIFGISC